MNADTFRHFYNYHSRASAQRGVQLPHRPGTRLIDVKRPDLVPKFPEQSYIKSRVVSCVICHRWSSSNFCLNKKPCWAGQPIHVCLTSRSPVSMPCFWSGFLNSGWASPVPCQEGIGWLCCTNHPHRGFICRKLPVFHLR